MKKNHGSIRKNTIRNNHFIQELIPRISPEMANLSENLLLGLKIIIWLYVLFSSDKLLASNNCCKTYYQPNSFTHSLTNLLYWAYWVHILFYLDLGYDLWPYRKYCVIQSIFVEPKFTVSRTVFMGWIFVFLFSFFFMHNFK